MNWSAFLDKLFLRPSTWDNQEAETYPSGNSKLPLKIPPREPPNLEEERQAKALARHPQLVVSAGKKLLRMDVLSAIFKSAPPKLTVIQGGAQKQPVPLTADQILNKAYELIDPLETHVELVDKLILQAHKIDQNFVEHRLESTDIRLGEVDDSIALRIAWHKIESGVRSLLDEARKTHSLLLSSTSSLDPARKRGADSARKRLKTRIDILANHEAVLHELEQKLNAELRNVGR